MDARPVQGSTSEEALPPAHEAADAGGPAGGGPAGGDLAPVDAPDAAASPAVADAGELPAQLLLDGQAAEPSRPVELRAGPLSLVYLDGDLRFVRYGDREILRRVYVAVRDPNWRTAVATVEDERVERREAGFRVTCTQRHRQREIEFVARITIEGREDGTLSYALDGTAESTFERGRIGICVLYPGDAAAGRPFTARTPEGKLELGTFPIEIAPHQPVHGHVALTHEVAPGLLATVRYAGEVFEMEDQRNWTDATYKAYSTPLSLPMPVRVERGTRIEQRATLTLTATGAPVLPGPWPPALTLALGAEPVGTLPEVGVGVARDAALGAREQDRLRALNLGHLRVDLHLADPAHETCLRDAHSQASALGVPLEAAVFVSDRVEEELGRLARLCEAVRPDVRRWIVLREDGRTTPDDDARLARRALGAVAPGAPVGGGTDAYFTQLNRDRPPTWALDFVSYSINPQVHAFDATSLVETLPAQGWTVRSARAFARGLPIVVSPVTLKPRFNASHARDEAPWQPGERNSTVDQRQPSLLGAAWTLGSLASLAEAGVASATYYETVGRGGVMETADGSGDAEHFRTLPGAVFPLYHVLADVAELAGAEVLPFRTSDAMRAMGLALRAGGRTRLLVANLSPETVRVRLEGVPGRPRTRRLDLTTALRAMREPEAFRAEPGRATTVRRGALTLELLPYSVARLDA